MYPGAAKWIFDQAAANAEHIRTMEKSGMRLRWWDAMPRRLLPFVVVMVFVIGSVVIAIFTNSPWGGVAGIGVTVGGVLIAYFTGKTSKSDGDSPGPA